MQPQENRPLETMAFLQRVDKVEKLFLELGIAEHLKKENHSYLRLNLDTLTEYQLIGILCFLGKTRSTFLCHVSFACGAQIGLHMNADGVVTIILDSHNHDIVNLFSRGKDLRHLVNRWGFMFFKLRATKYQVDVEQNICLVFRRLSTIAGAINRVEAHDLKITFV